MNITPSPGAARRPALGLLTALVLLAHWAALHGLPPLVEPGAATAVRPVLLRTVAATVTVPSAAAPGAAAGDPAPVTTPTPRPGTERPRVARASPSSAASAATADRPTLPPGPVEAALAPRLTHPNAVLLAASARLRYDVSGSSKGTAITGQSELRWQNTGQDYQASWELQLPTGRRVQTSVGRVSAVGLAPIRFADKARAEQAAHFERERAQIVFSANAPAAALLEGAQDRLSVLLQTGAMLAADPARFAAGAELAVQTAGPRDAAVWRFAVGETEPLALPGGSLAAVKLTRRTQGLYEPGLELWLAPALGYLPVRWRLSFGNGDAIDHQWRAIEAP